MAANDIDEFRHIPHEILTNLIIPKLPIKTLIRFKSVSKRWYSLISSSQFSNTHFKLRPFSSHTQSLFVKSGQSFNLFCYDDDNPEFAAYFGSSNGLIELNPNFDFRDLHLVGSSNGLVCLSSSSGFFIVWNPITNQSRKICDPFHVQSCHSSWGFGYCLFSNEYKIVRIVQNPKMIVHVFSLTKNHWKVIDDRFYMYLFSSGTIMSDVPASLSFRTRPGVCVNQSLYWIVENTQVPGRRIITFSLVLEEFDVFPYLDLVSSGLYDDDRLLCVMGGCLSSCRVTLSEDVYITMFKTPRQRESVVLLRDFRIGACDDAVGFTKSGKFFVVDRYCRKLGLVDRSSSPFKYIELARFETHDVHIANYVPTLISPFTDE